MTVMLNEAMRFGHETGPYEMIVTADDETWGVKGTTVKELLADAKGLRDEYALSEDQIMAMESDAEAEAACRDEKTAYEIYERVREWCDRMEERELAS